ncbi:MAG: hypothetical protein L0Y44_04030 [Phycisphaerales bacterium]|nr:hypothetical protein [Phycisphaerales bacterium]MCI0629806.1 hypothetical protein [Phycisphaerales bacterium]
MATFHGECDTALSAIVVSEFYIKQEIPPDVLRACVVLPFNWDDAVKAARIDFSKQERTDGQRDALKDDVKIMAQAIVKDAAWIITDDSQSLYKLALALRDSGASGVQPIKLEDGFDKSLFEPTRQRDLPYSQE